MSITWDEIRNTFYSKVSRNQILHTYVQSKPVNDVVYGQVVFDKTSLANKMLKESPIKVGHYQIPVVPTKILFMVNFNRVVDSVVEPFHFGPAPAPQHWLWIHIGTFYMDPSVSPGYSTGINFEN